MAERLFSRFVAMYGSQKVGAMWAPMDPSKADEEMRVVKETWAAAIGRFDPQSIAVAVRELLDSGREWPPTLPEFVELCRRGALSRQQAQAHALPAPRNVTREEAAEVLQRIGLWLDKDGKDPRAWARRILERVAAGESVPIAVHAMARQGLAARAE